MADTDVDVTEPDEVKVSMAVHVITPIATLAATWLVRKAMDTAYERTTGHTPPRASDPGVTTRQALMWAATTAAVIAITEVVIYRVSSRSARRALRG